MNYLFVYTNGARIGGVQTLTARLAEGLLEAGDTAKALFLSEISDGVDRLLPERCGRLSMPKRYRSSRLFPLNVRAWLRQHCREVDICVCFGKVAMHLAAANLSCFDRRPGLVSYIVNDSEHVRVKARFRDRFYSYLFHDKYFYERLPDADKFFMSETVLRIHEESVNRRLSDARVVPLPIKAPANTCRTRLRPFRMVSIGRIDGIMKTYNFTMPRVVRELRDEGYEVSWDVYGGGVRNDVEKFLNGVKDNGVEGYVTWHGELPYSEMKHALDNASAFLGMGTAAIEAAMHGIPSIVAVANAAEPVCYGFLHDLPFGMCGEARAYWVERKGIKGILSELYHSCPSDLEALAVLDQEHARQYEFRKIVSRFRQFAEQSRKVAVRPYPISWSLLQCLNGLRFNLAPST